MALRESCLSAAGLSEGVCVDDVSSHTSRPGCSSARSERPRSALAEAAQDVAELPERGVRAGVGSLAEALQDPADVEARRRVAARDLPVGRERVDDRRQSARDM